MTASEMFGVPVKGMPAEVRRRAKAINFGIIYGISAFGLANQLGIEREEAGAYIKKYFERFPGIRDYMDETSAISAGSNGYVLTLFGRKCHYPDITATQPLDPLLQRTRRHQRAAAGYAADIIRRAMVRMDAALAQSQTQRADAAAGARRTDLRGAGRRSQRPSRWSEGDGRKRRFRPWPLGAAAVDARAAANWDEAH